MNNIQSFKKMYGNTIITSLTTAIILLASLGWNDVVQSIINKYITTEKNTIIGKIYYALSITIIVILMQIYVFPLFQTK